MLDCEKPLAKIKKQSIALRRKERKLAIKQLETLVRLGASLRQKTMRCTAI